MATATPIIMAAATAYSVYSGFQAANAQEQAAAQAERIGRDNATVIEAETREEKRRLVKQQAQTEGTAKARVAASGQVGAGTTDAYLSDLSKANVEAVDWLMKSGKNRARIAISEGKYTAASGKAGAQGTRAAAVGNFAAGAAGTYEAGINAGWW